MGRKYNQQKNHLFEKINNKPTPAGLLKGFEENS